MKNANKGFTLIEVMVTVAILGILATIAYPSYTDYITRGRIPEGLAALSNARVAMEQIFMDNRVYNSMPALGGGTVNPCNDYINSFNTSYFDLTCTVITANTYTIAATGTGSMADFQYTIDNTGAKRTNITKNGWPAHATPNNNCWVIKKDGSCG